MGEETVQILKRLILTCLTALWLVNGALIAEESQDRPATQETPAQKLFPSDQIEQLVAHVAL